MAYEYPPASKTWDELPTAKSGTSDDKLSLVIQWILNGIFMVAPFLAIFTRGRRRRRLIMVTLWAMTQSFLLALSQEGAMQRFVHNWREGQKPDTKLPWDEPAKVNEPKPKVTGYGWDA